MSVSSPAEQLNVNEANGADLSVYSNPFAYGKYMGSSSLHLLQQGLAAAAAAAAANEKPLDEDEVDFDEGDSIDE